MKLSKTSVLGVLTIVGALVNLAIDSFAHGGVTEAGIGVAAAAIPAGIGLLLAKDHDVSNSPTPLAVAQKVELVPISAVEPVVSVATTDKK